MSYLLEREAVIHEVRFTFRIDVTVILFTQCWKHPNAQVLSEKVLLVKSKNGLIK